VLKNITLANFYYCFVVKVFDMRPGKNRKEVLKVRIEEVLTNKMVEELGTKGMSELVEEISIYHQELEFQNDELRRIQKELEESKIHLTSLFEDAPIGYVVCDENMIVKRANHYFLNLLKCSNSIQETKFTNLVDPDSQDAFYLYFKYISKSKYNEALEISLKTVEKKIVVKIESNVFFEGADKFFRIAVTDLSDRSKAEETLRESEEKYRSLTQSAHDAIVTSNSEGKIISWNSGASKIFGFSEEEVLGRDVSIIMPEKFRTLHSHYLERNESAGILKVSGRTLELTGARSNGKEFPIELSLSEWHASGQRYYTAIIRDISKRKLAEYQIKLLSRSVDQSPVSIIITDKNANIEYVNSMFTKTTGYNFDEVKGKNPRILNSGNHSSSFFKNLYDTVNSGSDWFGEVLNKSKSGQLFWEDIIISAVFDENGEISHFISIRDNITEKKRMMEELVIAKERAEESDKLKMAFLANMSHEIRTPMNGIMGFLDLLQNPELTAKNRLNYLSIARKSSERLLSTINDIIEISKIEAGQTEINLSEVDLYELMDFFHVFFKPEVEQKELLFKFVNPFRTPAFKIQTDKNKLESIIGNLLKNAIKFTNTGQIEFGCEVKAGQLLFYVKDSGIGIPEDRQSAVFQRFVQAETKIARPHEGSGLGLSIAKAYAEMLGGNLWLKSIPGNGSTFFFSMNYTMDLALAKIPQPEATAETLMPGGISILIAEDDPSSYSYLEALLLDEGFTLIHANNGLEAISLLKGNPHVSLILMDIKMPEMDGLQATREIRKFNALIPIIAQTAYAMPADMQSALDSGCSDYISKPVKIDSLLKAIRKALKN